MIYVWLWEREMFYLKTHLTHFIYGYMASDIWLRTILIVRKETCCRQHRLQGFFYMHHPTDRIAHTTAFGTPVVEHWLEREIAQPSHRQDSTYHSLCFTSCGALAGTRNSSMGPPHEGSIRRPIAPWANALPLTYGYMHVHVVYMMYQ